MTSSFNNIFYIFFISILTTPFLINSMELSPRPTIKTKVYFNPNKPAFYATNNQIKYLNSKGIPTPANLVLREVLKAEVVEDDGSITNWKQQPTKSVKKYETALLKQQQLSFDKNIAKGLAIKNKTFPGFLPVESSFNCTNSSKMNRTIEQFLTEITFASEGVFHIEQNICMVQFFKDPTGSSSQHDLHKHVETGLLNKKISTVPLTFENPFTNEYVVIETEKTEYSHGKNGCPDITVFVQRMANQKIDLQKTSVHGYIFNRQLNGK